MSYSIKGDINVLRRLFGKFLNLSSLSGTTDSMVLTADNTGEVIAKDIDYFLTGSTIFNLKLDTPTFALYSANTFNIINNNYNQFTGFTESFYAYSSYTLNYINSIAMSGSSQNIDSKYDKTGGTISGQVLVLGNVTGNTFYGVGGNLMLGTPPDGSYNTGLLGLNTGTTINDAVDQIDEILALLAPAKPNRLDQSTFITPTFTTALASRNWNVISGTSVSNIIMNNNQPLYIITGSSSGTFSGFWNGLSGNLSFFVNGNLNGFKDLTSSSVSQSTGNTGTYSGLTITVRDYYINQTGRSGFWSAISATGRTTNQLSYTIFTSHTYTFSHSETGSLSTLFYIDNPSTPSVLTPTITTFPSITRYVSGVPSLSNGDVFSVSYTINNAISKFYPIGVFGQLTTNSVTNGAWGTTTTFLGSSITPIPFSGDSVTLTNQNITTSNNRYGETLTVFGTGYNARSISSNSSVLTINGYRVDTVSNETIRLGSGTLQPYPTNYGYIYNSNTSLLSGNYINELQLLNGIYRYPNTNYIGYGGPTYTGLTTNRYVTFNVGSIINAANFTLNIVGNGFTTTSNQITNGIFLNVIISGSTGWLNGNSPYSSGIPTNDADPSMDSGNSTQTSTSISRRITLGPTTRTGNVFVKMGLPSGSTITITSITKV